MAALGVVAKIRVPYAHTSLQIIYQRYGKIGHAVFIVLNLVNNVFGCATMILTGSQLVYGVSGMHFVAACILIPLGGESFSLIFHVARFSAQADGKNSQSFFIPPLAV